MGSAPAAARSHVELARIGLGIRNKLGKGFGWNRWIDQHDEGHPDSARDWRDVADEIETEVVVKRVIERVRRCDKEKRIAIGWRAHDCLSGEIGCGARPVLNDKLLAKSLRQPLAHEACDDVPAGDPTINPPRRHGEACATAKR